VACDPKACAKPGSSKPIAVPKAALSLGVTVLRRGEEPCLRLSTDTLRTAQHVCVAAR
jgi:hypothetical protein